MFDTLSKGFDQVTKHFVGRTKLTDSSLNEISQIIKNSLIEADVEISVVESFLDAVNQKAKNLQLKLKTNKKKLSKKQSVSDLFISICFDELTELLGKNAYELSLKKHFNCIMLFGLQGVGKTTTCAKLAKYFSNKKPLLVACDIQRPAAVEQLQTLGSSINVPVFFKKDLTPLEICKQAKEHATANGHQLMIVDTAGRLSIDTQLMDELKSMKEFLTPDHNLLVVDTMMGQDSVDNAKRFNQTLAVDGFILSKFDGDARGGAALSITHVTQKPVVMIGTGESITDIDFFEPEGISSQILGLGDFSGLSRDIQQLEIDENTQEVKYDFNAMLKYLKIIARGKKLGSLIRKLPGKLDQKLPEGVLEDPKAMMKPISIIQSMTKSEKSFKVIFNESRIKRIASGSGNTDREVREFINNTVSMFNIHEQYQDPKTRNNLLSFLKKRNIAGFSQKDLQRGMFGFKNFDSENNDNMDTDSAVSSSKEKSNVINLKKSTASKKAKRKAQRKSSLRNRKKR